MPPEQAGQASRKTKQLPADFVRDLRQWVDNTGAHRTIAKLVAVEKNAVRLSKPNGRVVVVPVHRLSPRDVEYVQWWRDTLPESRAD